MCFFIFLCFDRVCGFLCVYNILATCFKFMFMSCSCIKLIFLCQGHVSDHGHVSVSRPCFSLKFLDHFTVYSLFLGDQMVLCFIISIHSKDIHPKITSSFCKFLCFMYYIFNMSHFHWLYFFYVLHSWVFLNSVFFVLFLVDWLANT
jgi:hypothetical protein